MDLAKYKKYLKDYNYVHCTICANYRNCTFTHRKSEIHQTRLTLKLRKMKFHLSQKVKEAIIVHDEGWEARNVERFCHFCGQSYLEHHKEDEFIIENLGCLLHYGNSQHVECVQAFLKRNFRNEKPEKYCVSRTDLDSFLEKLPAAKRRYLKKMDMLNDMILKDIKVSEEKRKKLVSDELQAQASSNYELQSSPNVTDIQRDEIKSLPMLQEKDHPKVPPWLDSSSSSAPVIGPTMDTLVKHVASQKKKGLLTYRVGANFKHQVQGSSKWLPSFQGVWNQGRRKQLQINFNQKNKNI